MLAMGPGLLLRDGAAAVVTGPAATGCRDSSAGTSCSSPLALRAAGRARRLQAQRGLVLRARRGRDRPAALPVHGRAPHRAARGLRRRGGRRRPAVPPWLGLADARARRSPPRRCAGGASRRSGRAGTPGSSWCRGCRWSPAGPYRWFRAPQLRRRRRRRFRPAAGAHRLGDRGGLHGAEHPAPGRTASRRGARAASGAGPRRDRAAALTVPSADLLVIGGGPVGPGDCPEAAPARACPSLVAEPRTSPVDKACGEGLMPSARAPACAARASQPHGHPFAGYHLRRSRRARVTADFPDGSGLGVRRLELHTALAEAARAAGVTRSSRDRPRLVAVRPTHVEAEVGGGRPASAATWRPPTACTRRSAPTSGWPCRPRGPSQLRAPPALERSRRGRDHVEVHWSAEAELYVTPVGGEMSASPCSRLRGRVVSRLAARSFLRWQQRLRAPRRRPRSAGPARSSSARVGGPPAGCCWSVTRPAMWTRSRGRGSLSACWARTALVGRRTRGRPAAATSATGARDETSRLLTLGLLRAASERPGLRSRMRLLATRHRRRSSPAPVSRVARSSSGSASGGRGCSGRAVDLLGLEQGGLVGHPVGLQDGEAGRPCRHARPGGRRPRRLRPAPW